MLKKKRKAGQFSGNALRHNAYSVIKKPRPKSQPFSDPRCVVAVLHHSVCRPSSRNHVVHRDDAASEYARKVQLPVALTL